MGNRDVEDSLEKLNKLTQEEAVMASAELLKMTQSVDGKVMGVDDRVKGVEGKMQDVRDDVQDVRGGVQDVRDNVQDVRDGVQGVCNNVEDVRDDVRDVRDKVQDVDDRVQDIGKDISIKLDQANRSLYLEHIIIIPTTQTGITGNQLRDNLLRWLSPPDPSTNHNIACKAHHNDTAKWFFRGSIFSQWKSSGSFLWIHGKRALHLALTCIDP
jgi:archaellum component FlaC